MFEYVIFLLIREFYFAVLNSKALIIPAFLLGDQMFRLVKIDPVYVPCVLKRQYLLKKINGRLRPIYIERGLASGYHHKIEPAEMYL